MDSHLNAIFRWCIVYDKGNYVRYLSPFFAKMTNLPEKDPDICEAFKAGQVSVQLSCNNSFGHIPVVPTIEANKDTQTPGGTTEFSQKADAIKRQIRQISHDNTLHTEQQQTCIKKIKKQYLQLCS